ncbi:hypothetical protein NFI96_024096 [Prochilodus magdalenae]|nr:hypothetical protein NFI96_024096 [Prochilodus magdalenae]
MFQCRHFLQLLAPESACELDVGSHLRLDLQIYGPVQVWFTSRSGSAVQLCSVSGRDVDCSPEYAKRVLVVGNTLLLMNLVPSDSGNYTVREEDGTLVSVLNMTVKDVQQCRTWMDEFGTVTVLFGFAMLVLGVFLGPVVVPWCRYQFDRLYKRCRGSSCGQGDEPGENAVPLKEDVQINMEPEG